MIDFDFKTHMKEINYSKYDKKIQEINAKLKNDNMNGWIDLPFNMTKKEINDIKKTAKYVRDNCDVLLVIGIGGSFLGAKMIISALSNYFEKSTTEVIFVGTSLSTNYLTDLKEYIKDKDVMINVISKSGSTLETNITFDYLLKIMNRKYENYQDRIIVTTDKDKSILLDLANEKGYKKFYIPGNVGGRYSVLTPVGLLPIAVAGINIEKLIEGAKNSNIDEAIKYAIIRQEMYEDDKYIENFVFYEEKYLEFGEWLKQLFAESHGKDGKGILPISTFYTRDLHSLGQYFQQGKQILFETVFNVVNTKEHIKTKFNKNIDEINEITVNAVAKAHMENNAYTNLITLSDIDEYNLGYLIYFFEMSAAIGGYLLGIDPFNQPGVSKYKEFINEGINK